MLDWYSHWWEYFQHYSLTLQIWSNKLIFIIIFLTKYHYYFLKHQYSDYFVMNYVNTKTPTREQTGSIVRLAKMSTFLTSLRKHDHMWFGQMSFLNDVHSWCQLRTLFWALRNWRLDLFWTVSDHLVCCSFWTATVSKPALPARWPESHGLSLSDPGQARLEQHMLRLSKLTLLHLGDSAACRSLPYSKSHARRSSSRWIILSPVI